MAAAWRLQLAGTLLVIGVLGVALHAVPATPPAVSGIVERLGDADAKVRAKAAWEAWRLGPRAKDATGALARALDDEDTDVRQAAASALASFGADAEPALPALIRELDRPRPVAGAMVALAAIGPPAHAAVPHLIALLRHDSPAIRLHAAWALASMGPDARAAAPDLVMLLDDHDGRVRNTAVDTLHGLGPAAAPAVLDQVRDAAQEAQPLAVFSRALAADVHRRRLAGVVGLGTLGPEAAPAVPALIALLRRCSWHECFNEEGELRAAADDALAAIGAAAVPALREVLAGKNSIARAEAARSIELMGATGREAVPALLGALSDPDLDTREAVTRALIGVGDGARPALAAAAEHGDARTRALAQYALREGRERQAARDTGCVAEPVYRLCERQRQREFVAADLRLAEVGESASTPVGARIAALPHEDPGGQDALAGQLAKEGPRVLGPLLHALGALGDPPLDAPRSLSEVDEGTFMAAFVTSTKVNDFCKAVGLASRDIGGPAVPALTEALGDARPPVRACAAQALGWIGPAASGAVAALTHTVDDPQRNVRDAAAEALGRIGPDAIGALDALAKRFAEDRDPGSYPGPAALAAGKLGAGAAATLTQKLTDSDPFVRRRAATALAGLGPDARQAVAPLVRLLGDADVQTREAAAHALSRIGADAVGALLEALTNGDENTRASAIEALVRIRPPRPEIIEALVRAGNDGRVSTQASFGLAGMGPAAAERIFAALHDPDENIRVHAAITIGRMQPATPRAVTVPLIGALGDGSQRVRYFVVQDLAALVRAGNTDVSILEALERARSDPDRFVQETAERVLREHRPTPPRP